MRKFFVLVCLFLGGLSGLHAQEKLDKRISISENGKSLSQVLAAIGRKGGFFFSYNTTILNGDSLVSIRVEDESIRKVLERLLGGGYEYSENGKYVIILPRSNAGPPVRFYTISGYIKDGENNQILRNVSVYESAQLVSVLTDTNGFFRLKLRGGTAHATLIVSKQFYRDTVLFVQPGHDQQFEIPIAHEKVADLTPFVVSGRVERTWLGRMFLSSRSVIQSINLSNFFADKPYQFSLIPGLGSHGRMGAQVINKFSLNLIGGYTAGSNGVEVAGILNIDKKDVSCVQVAGISNVVGGSVHGVQLAGIYNHDLDSMRGFQAAGIGNRVAGLVSGTQVAGLMNFSESVNGVQAAGVINHTKRLKGVQIGLINIADSSDGLQIGLINIVKNGMHEVSVFSTELMPFNIAYKTGTRRLYSILQVGFDATNNERVLGYGYGIGTQSTLSPRLALNTELTINNLRVGHDRNLPEITRIQSSLRVKLGPKVSLFAGPALSISSSPSFSAPDGDKTMLPRSGYATFSAGNVIGWVGFTAGINFF